MQNLFRVSTDEPGTLKIDLQKADQDYLFKIRYLAYIGNEFSLMVDCCKRQVDGSRYVNQKFIAVRNRYFE